MYGSLKRKNKRVNYLSYHPFGPNYEKIKKNQGSDKDDEYKLKLTEDTSPLKLADNNPQTEAVVKSNTGNEKPIVLKPKVNNKDNENNKITNKSYKNDSIFCIENVLLLLIFSMLVYCLYVYFTESKGRSSFGARDCASYDISKAYDMVK